MLATADKCNSNRQAMRETRKRSSAENPCLASRHEPCTDNEHGLRLNPHSMKEFENSNKPYYIIYQPRGIFFEQTLLSSKLCDTILQILHLFVRILHLFVRNIRYFERPFWKKIVYLSVPFFDVCMKNLHFFYNVRWNLPQYFNTIRSNKIYRNYRNPV